MVDVQNAPNEPTATVIVPPTTAELQSELLLGSVQITGLTDIGDYLRSLPRYIDDIEQDFGTNTYAKMLNDSAVYAAVMAIKTSVMSRGPSISGSVEAPTALAHRTPDSQAKFDQSEQIADEVEHMLADLTTPLESVLMEILDGLAYGHTLAEKVWEVSPAGKLVLRKLMVKPPDRYRFVVDKYMTNKGVLPLDIVYWGSGSQYSIVPPELVVPREKFLHFVPFTDRGDPRGKSMLRPAYNPWYLKQQVWPQQLKFLAQFATPSVAGVLPENASNLVVTDAYGNVSLDANGIPKMKTAAQAMVEKLVSWANGTAIALEFGSDIKLIQAAGDGQAYEQAIDLYDRQITRAILLNARAIMESKFGSRADSGSAVDVMQQFVGYVRLMLEVAIYRDVLKPYVRYNYGDDVAEEFTPRMVISDTDAENTFRRGEMIAHLAAAGVLHHSQFPGIDIQLDLPPRDLEQVAIEQEQQQQQQQMQAQEMSQLLNPMSSGTPAKKGTPPNA